MRNKAELTFCQLPGRRCCNWDVLRWNGLSWSDAFNFVIKHHTLIWKAVALSFWVASLKNSNNNNNNNFCFPWNLSYRTLTFPIFLPVEPRMQCSLEPQGSFPISQCCPDMLHIIKRLLTNYTFKTWRGEKRGEICLGQLPAGSHRIVSSEQYCAFDGCL